MRTQAEGCKSLSQSEGGMDMGQEEPWDRIFKMCSTDAIHFQTSLALGRVLVTNSNSRSCCIWNEEGAPNPGMTSNTKTHNKIQSIEYKSAKEFLCSFVMGANDGTARHHGKLLRLQL